MSINSQTYAIIYKGWIKKKEKKGGEILLLHCSTFFAPIVLLLNRWKSFCPIVSSDQESKIYHKHPLMKELETFFCQQMVFWECLSAVEIRKQTSNASGFPMKTAPSWRRLVHCFERVNKCKPAFNPIFATFFFTF